MDTAKLKAAPRHSVDGYGRQDISYKDPEGEFVFYSD
ncbi:ead/Ea22-like family protein, partial [Cronobacter sakazakii]|nr:ead/Ea22-like family protein [Cronobacter sakazakii]